MRAVWSIVGLEWLGGATSGSRGGVVEDVIGSFWYVVGLEVAICPAWECSGRVS